MRLQQMRNLFRLVLVVLTVTFSTAAPHAQQSPRGGALSLDAFVERVTKVESSVTTQMGAYHPVVEVYLQHLAASNPAVGPVPTRDDYFLGQFEGKDRPNMTPLNQG